MMQCYHVRGGCRQFVADIGIYFKFWGARTNTKRFFNIRADSSLKMTILCIIAISYDFYRPWQPN